MKEDFYEAGKIHRRTCCVSIRAVGKAKVCAKHARCLPKTYRRLVRFADSAGETVYSESLVNRFLQANYAFDLDTYTVSLYRSFRNEVRCIRVLGDYQLHGAILRRRTTRTPYTGTPEFAEALKAYYNECGKRNYSHQGMRGRRYRTELFLDYLDDHG